MKSLLFLKKDLAIKVYVYFCKEDIICTSISLTVLTKQIAFSISLLTII